MDWFHWAGVGIGLLMVLATAGLAWRDRLGITHVVVMAMGAVLAGIPVITMQTNSSGVTSVQIGDVRSAVTQTNDANKAQGQAIAALNDRVTKLTSLVAAIQAPVATTSGSPAAAPAAGPAMVGQSLNDQAQASASIAGSLHALQLSGAQVEAFTRQSAARTKAADMSLTKATGTF